MHEFCMCSPPKKIYPAFGVMKMMMVIIIIISNKHKDNLH